MLAGAIASHAWFQPSPLFENPAAPAVVILGVGVGIAIGMVSGLLGVAGGELLIPTLVLLYGVDVRVAGTVSLAISLPTLAVSLYRLSRVYRTRDGPTARHLTTWMALGSIAGALLGAALVGMVDSGVLGLLLAAGALHFRGQVVRTSLDCSS